MSFSSYLVSWLIYLLAASGCLIIGWRMTKNMTWQTLQLVWRSLFVALLLSPVYLDTEQSWLVPAYIVGSYDWILGQTERAQEALEVMGFVFVFTFALGLVDRALKSRISAQSSET